MVSSYNRGDSPARSGFSLVRNSSKRSRSSQSSNHLVPEQVEASDDGDEVSSLIAPAKTSEENLRAEDGSWMPLSDSGTLGIGPNLRGVELVPSLIDIEESRHLAEKNADVAVWLSRSEASSEVADNETQFTTARNTSSKRRPRAHSTNTSRDAVGQAIFNDFKIPGPGVLVDEDSGAETDDSASQLSGITPESPPADVETCAPNTVEYFPPVQDSTPDQGEPLPPQFYRARLWQDPLSGTSGTDRRDQPATSNAAIYKYDQQAAKFDTASRSATWGTRRRLSETDVSSVVEGSKLSQLSLRNEKSLERGASFINKARGLIPRRSSSNTRKKSPEDSPEHVTPGQDQKKRGDSLSSFKAHGRIPSFGKAAKSPSLNTSSALMAMTGQIAAIGRSTSVTPDTALTSSSPWKALTRQRSKSEMPKVLARSSATPSLAELMISHGGPPLPVLASPTQERSFPETSDRRPSVDEEDNDVDDDDTVEDKGVRMNLNMRVDNIIPSLDGFRTHARQLNPRLEPFLIERIGQEQQRRYKKLVENKVKHAHAVHKLRKCGSGKHCFSLGGEATILPPKTSAKDPETTCAQFQISGSGESDEEANTFAEGVVTAALFPSGIPLPPVKRLPAEFECPLCFKVKKFQKPSDWTKHVHEDVQPFTCTFPHCAEPKSFKRKADWVRHENERHRHLEWWKCNMTECNHICYRKDNFVQHLVREHKKVEPKVKSRGSGRSKITSVSSEVGSVGDWKARMQEKQVEEVWKLVEACHHETLRKSKEESCKFCGNVCNSWKKLTVHLAKHMEQIALPVLELARLRDVLPDTIISPVEETVQRPFIAVPAQKAPSKAESDGLWPHPSSDLPQYQGPTSASQSANLHSFYPSQMQDSNTFAGGAGADCGSHIPVQSREMAMADFVRLHGLPPNMSYGPYQDAGSHARFVAVNQLVAATYPPAHNVVQRILRGKSPQIPRSQPMQQPYGISVNTLHTGGYVQQQGRQVSSSPTESVHFPVQFDAGMDQLSEPTGMGFEGPHVVRTLPMQQGLMYDGQQRQGYHIPGNSPGYSY